MPVTRRLYVWSVCVCWIGSNGIHLNKCRLKRWVTNDYEIFYSNCVKWYGAQPAPHTIQTNTHSTQHSHVYGVCLCILIIIRNVELVLVASQWDQVQCTALNVRYNVYRSAFVVPKYIPYCFYICAAITCDARPPLALHWQIANHL